MPRHQVRPRGTGDRPVPRTPQPPIRGLRRRRSYTPRITPYLTRYHDPHPVSVVSAIILGDLYGRGINGHAGTISTASGRPWKPGKSANPATGFTGYAQPPQLFTGWNPGYQTEVGTPLTDPTGLPGTSLPLGSGSPLDSAMAQIMQGSS
jgi:hypothetical protein